MASVIKFVWCGWLWAIGAGSDTHRNALAASKTVLASGVHHQAPHHLTIAPNAPLKILQFADLHYGEGENTVWGPEQDLGSTLAMDLYFVYEPDTSFVVFSGDQITGNNIETNATAYWADALSVAVRRNTSFCSIMGNHDDAPCCSTMSAASTVEQIVRSNTTRAQLVQFEQSTYPDLSFTGMTNDTVNGTTNYVLPIAVVTNTSTVFVGALYFLDTGGGSYQEVLDSTQIAWLKDTAATINLAANKTLPALLFMHIPMPEYANAYQPLGSGSECIGNIDADGITPTVTNAGLYAALQDIGGFVGTFTGHDHGNDWMCPYGGMWLGYGRHSGYGGYGDWPRGARVFNISLSAGTAGTGGDTFVDDVSLSIQTWVRLENGTMLNPMQLL
jgi:predicted MPP superfamily phosphohydrolase